MQSRSDDDPMGKLWMHLNYLVEHCEENGIDREQAAIFFIGNAISHLVPECGPGPTAAYLDEMAAEVRAGEYDPESVANMTAPSIARN